MAWQIVAGARADDGGAGLTGLPVTGSWWSGYYSGGYVADAGWPRWLDPADGVWKPSSPYTPISVPTNVETPEISPQAAAIASPKFHWSRRFWYSSGWKSKNVGKATLTGPMQTMGQSLRIEMDALSVKISDGAVAIYRGVANDYFISQWNVEGDDPPADKRLIHAISSAVARYAYEANGLTRTRLVDTFDAAPDQATLQYPVNGARIHAGTRTIDVRVVPGLAEIYLQTSHAIDGGPVNASLFAITDANTWISQAFGTTQAAGVVQWLPDGSLVWHPDSHLAYDEGAPPPPPETGVAAAPLLLRTHVVGSSRAGLVVNVGGGVARAVLGFFVYHSRGRAVAPLYVVRRNPRFALRAASADTLRLERTKNGKRRFIPLTEEARQALLNRARFRAEFCPGSPWVFSHKSGARVAAVHHGFASLCKRAGIKDFRIHDLRHTCASWLVSGAVPLRVVQEMLGHSRAFQYPDDRTLCAPGAGEPQGRRACAGSDVTIRSRWGF